MHVGEHADLADAVGAACDLLGVKTARERFHARYWAEKPLYTADLSTWCVRYIWEPRHVRGFTDGAPAIVPLGFDPSIYGKDQGCRKAVLGRTGWWLYRADGGFGCCVPTEAQAIAWVEDGVLT